MRPIKARKPFILSKRNFKIGKVWYVRFWDEAVRQYTVARSTGVLVEGKRERRYEAEQASLEMLPRIKFTPLTVEKTFTQYLEDFWTPNSAYVREKALVKKSPLSADYIKMNHSDIELHIASYPPFQEITIKNLTSGMIRDWLTWMAGKKVVFKKKDGTVREGGLLSGSRINSVLQGMRVAVRNAIDREELDRDPFRGIGKVAEMSKEKGVLTLDELIRLINAPITDPRHRLAVLLPALSSMRMGEVRGLLWENIGIETIHIKNNWINGEGRKAPKCKGGSVRENPRTVFLPSSIAVILETLRSLNSAPDSFILESFQIPGEPVSKEFFRYVLDKELTAIGIPGEWKGKGQAPEGYVNEQKKRNITFHSLRHTFITIGRLAGLSDFEIQALAGHRNGSMMERYSHASQVLDYAALREKFEKVLVK